MSEQTWSGQPAQGAPVYGSTTVRDTQGYPQPTYPRRPQHYEYSSPVYPAVSEPAPLNAHPEAPPPAAVAGGEEEEAGSAGSFLALSILLTVLSVLTAGLCTPLALAALLFSVRSSMSSCHGNLKLARSSGRCALRLNAACMIASLLLFCAAIFSAVVAYLVVKGVETVTV